ncbi:MAG: DinB family protein [Dermatophilaceae bacterium]|nr:DinB family protein [Intrasporangiaceae bacterium]
MEPTAIEPDERDWTVVIVDGCAECGFSPTFDVTRTGASVRATIPFWEEALTRPQARDRPAPTTWSPLEYGCHVRDVCRLFLERLDLMLTDDDARFANWDQDATAVADRYHEQDPRTVSREYAAAAEALAAAFDAVADQQWQRRGTRSNGSQFTVATFAVYLMHDLLHHERDVAPTG